MSIADGRLNKQVAADLHVSEATIKAHLTGIFRKLGVHNRTQAMLALQPVLGGASGGGLAQSANPSRPKRAFRVMTASRTIATGSRVAGASSSRMTPRTRVSCSSMPNS